VKASLQPINSLCMILSKLFYYVRHFVVLEMTQFKTIVSGFMQHIESISNEVEKEKLKVINVF